MNWLYTSHNSTDQTSQFPSPSACIFCLLIWFSLSISINISHICLTSSPVIGSTKSLMAMVLLFVTVILISLSGVSMSTVYRVGDSDGWTIIGHPDYKKWASTKEFHLGDTLIFSYHKQYHDVMEVSHHDYDHCNTNSAKAFYHSGSDFVNLTMPGDFYFICSNDGHCQAGQKLHIKVNDTLHPSSLLVTSLIPDYSLGGEGDSVSLSPVVIPDPSRNNAAILTASCLTFAAVLALATYFLV